MLHDEIFIRKSCSLASMKSGRNFAALSHHMRNDFIELSAFISENPSRFLVLSSSFTETNEIICSLWRHVAVQSEDNASSWLSPDFNVEVDFFKNFFYDLVFLTSVYTDLVGHHVKFLCPIE